MDANPPQENSIGRATASVAAVSLAMWVMAYYAWALAPLVMEPSSAAQGHSGIAPWVFMQNLAHQLSEADLFQNPGIAGKFGSFIFALYWALGVSVLGFGIIRRLRLPELDRAERLALGALTGVLLVSTLTTVIGMTGGLQSYVPIVGMVAILSFLFMTEVLFLYRPRERSPVPGALVTLRILATVFLVALFLNCCTPPVQSDAMRYHLAAPQEWRKLGHIGYLPLNAFSNFPMLVEVQALLVGMAGMAATQMVHFALMLATGLTVYGLALRIGRLCGQNDSRIPATVAALLYMFTPCGAVVATWPNIDHATSLCVLLSTLALLLVMEQPRWECYVLLGITAGASLSVKYTLLAHLGLLGIVWLGWTLYKKTHSSEIQGAWLHTLRKNIVGAGLAVLVAGLLASPWYLKNVVFTGNPVYPFASGIFKGGEWTPECARLYATQAARKGEPKTIPNLLASPVRSTFDWLKYETHNPGAVTGIAWLTWVFAAIVAARRRNLALTVILFLAAGYWVVWFYSYQSNRMLLPFYALVLPCLPCVVAAAAAPLRRAMVGVLAVTAFVGGFWAIQWSYTRSALSPPPLPYLLGGMAEEVYMAKSLNYWKAYEYLNGRVKPDEKVLLIGEHRIYGAKFKAVWSDWYDTPAIAAWIRGRNIVSLDALLESLRSGNVNYVLINESELALQMDLFRPRFSASEWEIVSQLRALKDARVERRVIQPPPRIHPAAPETPPSHGVTVLKLIGGVGSPP
ncbi:MAG: glycosyltransferase family 39 protein [Candidatus Sumerlaeaceae bacterium]